MGEEGRPEAAWDKRRSTRLCEMHVGVSEALGLICNGRLQLCSAVPCGVGSGGGRFVWLCFRRRTKLWCAEFPRRRAALGSAPRSLGWPSWQAPRSFFGEARRGSASSLARDPRHGDELQGELAPETQHCNAEARCKGTATEGPWGGRETAGLSPPGEEAAKIPASIPCSSRLAPLEPEWEPKSAD